MVLAIGILCLTLTCVRAQTNTIIVPKEAETSFGGSYESPIRGGGPDGFQQVYGASAFAEARSDVLIITDFAFRVDEAYESGMDGSVGRLRIRMNVFHGSFEDIIKQGSGHQAPIAIVFDEEDVRLVGRGGILDAFDLRFRLKSPFIYDRRLGPLVLSFHYYEARGMASFDAVHVPSLGFSIEYEPLNGRPRYEQLVMTTKFAYVLPPEIKEIRKQGNIIEIDFRHFGPIEGVQFETSDIVDGNYSIIENAQLTPLSSGLGRGTVEFQEGKRFFRIRESMP